MRRPTAKPLSMISSGDVSGTWGRLAGSNIFSVTVDDAKITHSYLFSHKVQYAVTLSYSGKPIVIDAPESVNISDSGDFGILDAFEGLEYISWAIAAAAALATGFVTYYYKNPIFGSFQDYLTLIMWGAGMDQGKNFLQALQSVSSQPAGPPSAHGSAPN